MADETKRAKEEEVELSSIESGEAYEEFMDELTKLHENGGVIFLDEVYAFDDTSEKRIWVIANYYNSPKYICRTMDEHEEPKFQKISASKLKAEVYKWDEVAVDETLLKTIVPEKLAKEINKKNVKGTLHVIPPNWNPIDEKEKKAANLLVYTLASNLIAVNPRYTRESAIEEIRAKLFDPKEA